MWIRMLFVVISIYQGHAMMYYETLFVINASQFDEKLDLLRKNLTLSYVIPSVVFTVAHVAVVIEYHVNGNTKTYVVGFHSLVIIAVFLLPIVATIVRKKIFSTLDELSDKKKAEKVKQKFVFAHILSILNSLGLVVLCLVILCYSNNQYIVESLMSLITAVPHFTSLNTIFMDDYKTGCVCCKKTNPTEKTSSEQETNSAN